MGTEPPAPDSPEILLTVEDADAFRVEVKEAIGELLDVGRDVLRESRVLVHETVVEMLDVGSDPVEIRERLEGIFAARRMPNGIRSTRVLNSMNEGLTAAMEDAIEGRPLGEWSQPWCGERAEAQARLATVFLDHDMGLPMMIADAGRQKRVDPTNL